MTKVYVLIATVKYRGRRDVVLGSYSNDEDAVAAMNVRIASRDSWADVAWRIEAQVESLEDLENQLAQA